MTFVRREYGSVDIEVKFVTGHHDDNTPFDGSGQTLAHAYFPQYGGDAHFDDDERWTVHMPDGNSYVYFILIRYVQNSDEYDQTLIYVDTASSIA